MTDQYFFGLIVVTVCIMAFLALSVLLIFNISQRRILHEVSLHQEQELAFQQKLIEHAIETQEGERKRIAQELHDDIGSQLNIINLNVNLMQQEETSLDNNKTMKRAQQVLEETIIRTREISHQLLPPVLDKFGPQSAIESLVSQINRSGVLQATFSTEKEWLRMGSMHELHIYRIVQELISNTIKHANANNIKIVSNCDDDMLNLKFYDDGTGIVSVDKLTTGMGFQNIFSRLKLLGATYTLNNPEEEGFRIEFQIPVLKKMMNEFEKV